MDQLFELLHLIVNIIRITYYYLSPILVNTSEIIFDAFNIQKKDIDADTINNFKQINGKKVKGIDILFKRIQKD